MVQLGVFSLSRYCLSNVYRCHGGMALHVFPPPAGVMAGSVSLDAVLIKWALLAERWQLWLWLFSL